MQPLRFAVIGAGNIGKIHLQAIEEVPGAVATVLVSRTRATGQPIADTHGCTWCADWSQAILRPDVDAVAVCTPTGTHMEIAVAAAQAGKHLLVEKPLDITLERADAIIDAAVQNGVKLACIFPRRFAAGSQQAKRAIEAGRLGRMTLADVYVKWHRTQAYYEGSGNWRGTWALDGGGALMNQSIHQIDLVRWLVGPVRSVFARTATLAHTMQAEDTACAVLEYANGALGVIQGATSAWPGEPARVAIHGERGSIVLEEGKIVRWKLEDAADGEEESMLTLEETAASGAADPTAIGFEMHRRQVLDLVDAVQNDRPPAIAGAEGRHAIEIVRAMYDSAEQGSAVLIDA